MLADRELVARRLTGSRAVIHLAGIPHPHWPGATAETFVRLNYDAAVNVFEATRDAGVPTFVFASSAQVYGINNPVRLDHLPILESNYLPLPAEGQTIYGFLKGAFERYLDGACMTGPTQAVALRLECPGFRSPGAANLFVSTSVENTIDGFACACHAPGRPPLRRLQPCRRRRRPRASPTSARSFAAAGRYVPSNLRGRNPSLLSVEKAQRVLGYRPVTNGRYIDPDLVW